MDDTSEVGAHGRALVERSLWVAVERNLSWALLNDGALAGCEPIGPAALRLQPFAVLFHDFEVVAYVFARRREPFAGRAVDLLPRVFSARDEIADQDAG